VSIAISAFSCSSSQFELENTIAHLISTPFLRILVSQLSRGHQGRVHDVRRGGGLYRLSEDLAMLHRPNSFSSLVRNASTTFSAADRITEYAKTNTKTVSDCKATSIRGELQGKCEGPIRCASKPHIWNCEFHSISRRTATRDTHTLTPRRLTRLPSPTGARDIGVLRYCGVNIE